jgi:hypothetical protein
MSLFGRAVVAAAHARSTARALAARFPRAHQELTLRRLMRIAEKTAFGRAHHFDRIRTPRDLRERLPLQRYSDLKPWFERGLAGEPDVTWPGKLGYYGMTSGTTSGNKYLPISAELIRNQRIGGFEPLASYLSWTNDSRLLDGRAILLGGCQSLDQNEHGILIGDNTGIMAAHMPKLVAKNYLPSRPVREMRDWNAKLVAAAREAMREDVRIVAGTPGWFPGLFDQVLLAARESGRRAETIRDVWPNLRLITGGGISYEPYRPLIEARLGRSLPYVDVYNATEGGIMGVQDREHDRAMLMLSDAGVYYEFVPLEELEKAAPRRFSLWEVEAGVPYAIVMSTPSGVFGYLLGDCVRFVETFPHRFLFEGRTAGFLNLTGEHVSQGELEQAVAAACSSAKATLADFTVVGEVAERESPARHVFYVELVGPDPDLNVLARGIDAGIRRHNDDYATHRDARSGLAAPAIERVPAGTFHLFMERRGKLGGQNKVPRVLKLEERQSLEESARALEPSRRSNGHAP